MICSWCTCQTESPRCDFDPWRSVRQALCYLSSLDPACHIELWKHTRILTAVCGLLDLLEISHYVQWCVISFSTAQIWHHCIKCSMVDAVFVPKFLGNCETSFTIPSPQMPMWGLQYYRKCLNGCEQGITARERFPETGHENKKWGRKLIIFFSKPEDSSLQETTSHFILIMKLCQFDFFTFG